MLRNCKELFCNVLLYIARETPESGNSRFRFGLLFLLGEFLLLFWLSLYYPVIRKPQLSYGIEKYGMFAGHTGTVKYLDTLLIIKYCFWLRATYSTF